MRAPEFWSRTDPAARMLAAALSPLGFVHGQSIAWKHRFHAPYRSRASVICVGNLTAGGTGKTPLAIALARLFVREHIAVAFLTRGYGRDGRETLLVDPRVHDAASVGDEALLLARTATTVAARDRAEGARLAEAQGARLILMDDGHQNFTLAKDLSLVVVDGDGAFGNGRIMPAGPLREPVRQGLGRADGVVVMGDGAPSLPDFTGPALRARLKSDRRFDGERLTAFAGIGRPDNFFALLRSLGAELAETHSFPDHHAYSAAEIAMLDAHAKQNNAALITTEKDYVRLGTRDREGIRVLPVYATFDDPLALARVLDPLLAQMVAHP